MVSRSISWSKEAFRQFNKAIDYIAHDSLQNAEKVRADILTTIITLLTHPEKYSPDKYKVDNDGNFRAFELHKYRIAYHVSPTEIRILRVRHTSMEPRLY